MSEPSADDRVTVLLVEDNPGDVRLTREAFRSIDLEVEFHVATDGEEAVKYVQRHRAEELDPTLDLILLDLNLPRIDGFHVLEYLERDADSPRPPVIVLSSSQTAEDVARSYEKGCNAYLTKPADVSELGSMAESIEKFWFDHVVLPGARS